MKLFVLAESSSGYTFNFEVYTGKTGNVPTFGLAYDVIFRLMQMLFGQGYRLYVDNYYSSVQLCKDLLKEQTTLCRTILTNRRGIPKIMKCKKKLKERGTAQWIRDGNVVFLQWQDNKKVTFISPMCAHANAHVECQRK